MLTSINPKLPMRNKATTKDFYINQMGFKDFGMADFDGYLMVEKDNIQIHFFEFKDLNPKENYGQVYIRTNDIDALYNTMKEKDVACSPIEDKLWMQREFSILDPDNNLLTFGQSIL
ncbi:glyoxalase/bleomycin resistance/extradiol dioxygenase family protein [Chitinophagaceae bacterium IBVUCB1]|nr:glyoxalase/bleomycin resistance/extradiol dioxygenase family protein [Chitinophagaceae bacterium IBVUCB1]